MFTDTGHAAKVFLAESGRPTLILMPPMPSSMDCVARAFTSSNVALRKPPEVL
jgi:hypothetical protein